MWSPCRSLVIVVLAVFSSFPAVATAQSKFDGTQTIRLRNTQEPLTPLEMAALNQMALAIDRGSVNDLAAAFDALACGDGCGRILDAQRMLHRAARDSTPDIVGMLLDAGASPNLRIAPLDWTPLLSALAAARPANARLLVERGADPSLTGLDGTSAPFMAEILGLGDVIPYPPLQLSREDANSILLLAIEANDLAAVRFALEAGADPSATSPENGWSALMIASFHGFFDLAQELIQAAGSAGPDLIGYQEPEGGLSALHATVLGTRRNAPESHICTLDVLLSNGGTLLSSTFSGLFATDIMENMNLSDMIARLTYFRVMDRCNARQGSVEEVALVDAVPPASPDTSGARIQIQPPATDAQMPQEELVRSLQRGLDVHNCRPGPIDGIFGSQSARAIHLFNMVRPDSCPALSVLESIGRSEAPSDWRSSAQMNVDTLATCSPEPACGTPPGPDYYREFSLGCWYHRANALPGEYATWDGSCDTDRFLNGQGTLTLHYPPGAAIPDDYAVTKSGFFVRGANGTGQMIFRLLDGRVLYVDYFNGRQVSVREVRP